MRRCSTLFAFRVPEIKTRSYHYTPIRMAKQNNQTKRIKYLGLNLPKETKDLYAENYKTPMKEMKDDTNGEIYHVVGFEESAL